MLRFFDPEFGILPLAMKSKHVTVKKTLCNEEFRVVKGEEEEEEEAKQDAKPLQMHMPPHKRQRNINVKTEEKQEKKEVHELPRKRQRHNTPGAAFARRTATSQEFGHHELSTDVQHTPAVGRYVVNDILCTHPATLGGRRPAQVQVAWAPTWEDRATMLAEVPNLVHAQKKVEEEALDNFAFDDFKTTAKRQNKCSAPVGRCVVKSILCSRPATAKGRPAQVLVEWAPTWECRAIMRAEVPTLVREIVEDETYHPSH